MSDALTTILEALGRSDDTFIKPLGVHTKSVLQNDGGSTVLASGEQKNDVSPCQIRADSRTEVPSEKLKGLFFPLARALHLHQGQDSSLALALIAWGEENEPKAVEYIAANVGTPENVRRALGAIFRAAVRVCPAQVEEWVSEDREAYLCLTSYIERKPTPAYITWADSTLKFRLDAADLRVIQHIRDSDRLERAAIIAAG